MLWSVVRTQEEMQNLSNEWNDLLNCSASNVPFLRHEYLTSWWETRGGGEWPEAELYVVLARDENGALVGIAPLFQSINRDGESALMLLGSIEISDYLDFIVCLEELPTFLAGLLDFLNNQQPPDWQVLDFYNLLESTATLSSLQKEALGRGWRFQLEPLQHCPCIPLPGDWETYLAGIDKKQRHEIRRKMRRAQEYALEWGVPVRWYIANDGNTLESEMDDFMELMAQDEEKKRFLTPIMRTQSQLTARAALEAGWLQLTFLEVDGKKAAGYLNFDYQGHIWVYNSGINFALRELSPGWVLLGHLLQWANENGRSTFDFMRGDEEYKYRFGGVDRRVMRAKIYRS